MATKPKQIELPGVERKKIKEIEDAAESYVALRDKRMALLEKEIESKAVLLDTMHKHKLTVYRLDDGRIVEVLPTEKVKVKASPEDGDGDD